MNSSEYKFDKATGRFLLYADMFDETQAVSELSEAERKIFYAELNRQWDAMESVQIGYDSESDTLRHIKRVNHLLIEAAVELLKRGQVHDNSKLLEPEKSLFDLYTPLLKNSVYGSEEYKQFLVDLKVALDHHYSKNTHHPEYYEYGINQMNLFDVVEMFFDWKAATERQDTGDIYKSIDINSVRFNMSDELINIFKNTADYLGYNKLV